MVILWQYGNENGLIPVTGEGWDALDPDDWFPPERGGAAIAVVAENPVEGNYSVRITTTGAYQWGGPARVIDPVGLTQYPRLNFRTYVRANAEALAIGAHSWIVTIPFSAAGVPTPYEQGGRHRDLIHLWVRPTGVTLETWLCTDPATRDATGVIINPNGNSGAKYEFVSAPMAISPDTDYYCELEYDQASGRARLYFAPAGTPGPIAPLLALTLPSGWAGVDTTGTPPRAGTVAITIMARGTTPPSPQVWWYDAHAAADEYIGPLQAAPPVTVTVDPLSATLAVNQAQMFTATPSGGTAPYSIEWVDAVQGNLLGIGQTYTFSSPTTGQYGMFARATDSLGSVGTSDVVPITVSDAPPATRLLTVDSQPSTGTFQVGSLSYTTPVSLQVVEGSYTLQVQTPQTIGAQQYQFQNWADLPSTDPQYANPTRTVSMAGAEFVDKSISFNLTPVVAQQGILAITTAGAQGQVFVNGQNWGIAPQSRQVNEGMYLVQFGAVSGFTTPPDQSVSVFAGQTTQVVGTYVAIPVQTYDETITVLKDGVPVQDAVVSVISGPTAPPSQTTNAQGQVTFTGLLAGSYVFLAQYVAEVGKPAETGTVTVDPSTTATASVSVQPTAAPNIGLAIAVALAGIVGGLVLFGGRKKRR